MERAGYRIGYSSVVSAVRLLLKPHGGRPVRRLVVFLVFGVCLTFAFCCRRVCAFIEGRARLDQGLLHLHGGWIRGGVADGEHGCVRHGHGTGEKAEEFPLSYDIVVLRFIASVRQSPPPTVPAIACCGLPCHCTTRHSFFFCFLGL